MRHESTTAISRAGAFRRGCGLSLALGLALALGGCGSVNERMSEAIGSAPGIGLPAGAPERPAEADRPVYPAVHSMPPQRTTGVLTADEQRQVERELVSARDGQREAASGAAPEAAALAPVARTPKPVIQPKPAAARKPPSASSAGTIY